MTSVVTAPESTAAVPAPGFEHDAFISYSRKDKAFAAALEGALEAYRPPRDLSVPQRHLRVFRDEADLTGAEYHQSVERHLASARKLIVLCSPNSRKSEYVADEIQRFVHHRGAANVIPILVAGIPNNEAGDDRQAEMAFPDALCEALPMPLAAGYTGFDARTDRVQKGAFENAWHIVLSNLYDVGRAELEQREKRRQARQRRFRAAVAGTFVVVLSIGLVVSLYFWRQAVLERNTALSRELAATALGELARDPDLSVVLAMEGLRVSRTAQAEAALREALLTTRVLSVMEGHKRALTSAALSLDGQFTALASQDNSASVWRVETGERVALMRGHGDNVVDVAFSHDGRRIVTASWDNTARVWDAATGGQLLELRGHAQPVTGARFSPDGRLVVTGSSDGTVRLWNADNGQAVRVIQAHERVGPLHGGVVRIAFSPDGGQLLTSSGNHVTASGDVAAKLWNVADGALVRELPAGKAGVVIAAAFSTDGSRILVAGNRGSSAWDRASGTRLSEFHNHTGVLEAAAFSPDGRIALTADGNGTVVLTDTSTGRVLAPLSGHLESVRSAAFDTDGRRVLTGTRDGSTLIWDVASATLIARLTGQRDDPVATAFGSDPTTVFTANRDGSARLWSAGDARRVQVLPLGGDADMAPRITPDGAFLIGQTSNEVIVWDSGTGRELARMPATSSILGPGGQLVLTGQTDNVPADLAHASGATLRFARSSDSLLAVSRDGRLIFTTDEQYNGSIRRLDTGAEVHPLTGHGSPMHDAVFAPDGQWVVSVEDLGAFVWDVASGRERHQLPLDNRGYHGLLSPDQRLLAVVADTAHTRIWEVGSWRRLPDAIGSDQDSAWAKAGAWSPDSTRLAVGDNGGTTRVWDVRANRLVAAFPAHRYGVTTVAFSPDGALLLTTGLDERARIWNPSTGQLVAEVAGGPAGALFTPDGRRIATIAPRGNVSVHPWEAFAPVGTLERLAALRVKRALTPDERERYLHEPRPAQ